MPPLKRTFAMKKAVPSVDPKINDCEYHMSTMEVLSFIHSHQTQLKKNIKLLCPNASFSWSEINFLFKHYVWRFLCQNFIGLGWIVCLQPQFEVILVFTVEAKLRIAYKSVLL